MRRAILAACGGVVLLTAACGASGGSSPAAPGAPAVAPADHVAVPVQARPARQAQPAPAPTQAPAQPARPAPAPTSAGSSGGSGPAVIDDGSRPACPIGGGPPLHKVCPE